MQYPFPRKRFGQHFLHDAQIIQRIIQTIAPTKADHVFEIGPGQGALTKHLVDRVGLLDLIEIDRDLSEVLSHTYKTHPHVRIHNVDALQFDFAAYLSNPHSACLVGNLPYNVSTPLLFHFLNYHSLIADMYFMLQKEVIERMVASPGSKTYGRLSVTMQYYCQAEYLFYVPPHAFYPPPKVDSAVIRLTPYRVLPSPAIDTTLFSHIVRDAFNQRRKTLRNSLQAWVETADWAQLDLSPDARAEKLTVADFVKISNHIALRALKG